MSHAPRVEIYPADGLIAMTAKEKDQAQWSRETLMGMAFMESRVLLTGAELDLFTLAATQPLSVEQIAERKGSWIQKHETICTLSRNKGGLRYKYPQFGMQQNLRFTF